MTVDRADLVAAATAVLAAREAVDIGVTGAEDRLTGAYAHLLVQQRDAGLLGDAVETAEELVALRRTTGDRSLEALLRHEEALALQEEAISWSPAHAAARLACLREQAQVRAALGGLDPDRATGGVVTLLEVAGVLLERGEEREVRGLAAQALALVPGVPDEQDRLVLETEAQTLRALSLSTSRRRRNRQEAVEAAERAVALERTPRTLWAQATVLERVGRRAEAVALADEGLALGGHRSRDRVHDDLVRLRELLAS
jgi:tetratricopeptide (TPR) repeat protein